MKIKSEEKNFIFRVLRE
ncbi:MAG: hypothetical protein ACKVJP_11740 [Flavobacteriales bacterium]